MFLHTQSQPIQAWTYIFLQVPEIPPSPSPLCLTCLRAGVQDLVTVVLK